jgi:dolichol-phosphate mannosyltransferase
METSEKLGLVIPTLNEAGNIAAALQRVRASLDPLGVNYDITVVDDDSRDGTAQVVQEIAAQDPRVKLLVRRGERGLAGGHLRLAKYGCGSPGRHGRRSAASP